MIKIKDGYAKLIGATYNGSADRVLLSNGGDHILGNASNNIPLSNGAVNTNLNADLLDGYHSENFIFHKKYLELSALPSSTEGWYKIATITDSLGSPCIFAVRTYAHSSVIFTVSKGYDTIGNITVLQSCINENPDYAHIKAARIISGGIVEILLNKPKSNNSSYVNISISAYNTDNVKLNDTLELDTETTSSIDTKTFINKSILTSKLEVDGIYALSSSTSTTSSLGTSGLVLKSGGNGKLYWDSLIESYTKEESDSLFYGATVSRVKNTVLAAPNGSDGVASFRKLVIADMPDEVFKHLGDENKASVWSWGTVSGTSSWSSTASDRGYRGQYGTNLDISGYNTWYHRFAMCTDGRIEYWHGINTKTLTKLGTIAWISDIPTKTSQLINDSSFITGGPYIPISGTNSLSGSIIMPGSSSTTPFIRNFTLDGTSGWARDIIDILVDGSSKFAIGAKGNYTKGSSSNSIEYAYIGCNNFDGLNLKITTNSLKWGNNTILHAGNSSVSGNGGSTWGSSVTVKINDTEKTLTIPSNPAASSKDWFTALSLTKTITVEGNSSYWYPVVITCSTDKQRPTFISIWKDLGTTTPSIEGNHPNGTSSLWLQYEMRNTTWDGNGGYVKTWYKCQGYGTLVAHTRTNTKNKGSLIVWLRGGTCTYNISCTNTFSYNIYYSNTNIDSSGSTDYVDKMSSVDNGGIYTSTYLGYGNIYGNATTATIAETANSVAWANVTGKPSLVTSVDIANGDGIGVSGSPITSSGTITISNAGVRSVAIGSGDNANKLVVNTNGTTKYLTIPYAENANIANNAGFANQAGSADTADILSNSRTIALSGAVTGSASFNGSTNITITTSVNHTHSYLPLIGGTLYNSGNMNPLSINSDSGESGIKFLIAYANKGWIGYNASYGVGIYNYARGKYLNYKDNGTLLFEDNDVLHSGNWSSYITIPTKTSQLTNDSGFITGGPYLPSLRMKNPSLGTSSHGTIPFILSLKSAGTPLYDDPEFATGTNDVYVYNNTSGGAVTITRLSDSSAANSSGYVLKIATTSGTASPGRGGFYQTFYSRLNAVFAQIFRAKIPINYSVENSENSMGTGYTTFWLTDTAGTGKWEWYVRVTICGNSGTYSSGGHVYLSGSGAVTWYLAYCNVIDLTKGNYDGLRTKYADNVDVATKLGTTTKGSTTKPIYLSAGTPTECSTYAGGTSVTLNGASKSGSIASFYAPTTLGTNGQVLTSNGTAVYWTTPFSNKYFMPTNAFGGSPMDINIISNAMYAADKRYTVTLTGITGASSNLFNGNYETGCTISAGGTGTITISRGTNYEGYSYGDLYISFYYTNVPQSVTCRVYCDYSQQGIGWKTLTPTIFNVNKDASGNIVNKLIYKFNNSYHNISKFEFTITAKSGISTQVTLIDYCLSRGALEQLPVVTKFRDNVLYHKLSFNKELNIYKDSTTGERMIEDVGSSSGLKIKTSSPDGLLLHSKSTIDYIILFKGSNIAPHEDSSPIYLGKESYPWGKVYTKEIYILGHTATKNLTAKVSADSNNNIYLATNDKVMLACISTESTSVSGIVRPSLSLGGKVSLGESAYPWESLYVKNGIKLKGNTNYFSIHAPGGTHSSNETFILPYTGGTLVTENSPAMVKGWATYSFSYTNGTSSTYTMTLKAKGGVSIVDNPTYYEYNTYTGILIRITSDCKNTSGAYGTINDSLMVWGLASVATLSLLITKTTVLLSGGTVHYYLVYCKNTSGTALTSGSGTLNFIYF